MHDGHFDFGRYKKFEFCAVVCAVYLLISFVLFLPEIGNVNTTVIGNSGDVYQNLWNLWWTKHAIYSNVGIYSNTTLLFWPVGFNLVFQTLSPISGLISIPFQSISLEFAYNFLFFLGFVISGFGGFILIEYLLKERYAAFLGGLFFGFSAFHIANAYHHLDFFFIGWLPIFIYFFLRSIEENNRYFLALGVGVSFVLIIFMDELEEGLLVLLVALSILLLYVKSAKDRKKVLNIRFGLAVIVMALTVLVIGSFGIVPIISTALSPGGLQAAYSQNSVSDNVAWSADLISFFVPNYYFYNDAFSNSISNLFYGSNDRTVYIGYSVIILAACGIYKNTRKYIFWFLLFLAFFWLSLGPYIKIGHRVTGLFGPYIIYHALPYLNVIREPARFYLVASLAIAIIAAAGAKSVFDWIKENKKSGYYVYCFTIIVSIIFLLETFGIPTGQSPTITITPYVPQALRNLANTTNGNYSFVVLPSPTIPNYIYSGIADYYVTVLGRPLVGGFITREVQENQLSVYDIPLIQSDSYLATYNNYSFFTQPYTSPIRENYTLLSLKTLGDYGTKYVIIENRAYGSPELESMVGFDYQLFGRPLYSDSNITIFSTSNALSVNFYNNNFISYYSPSHWNYLALSNYVGGWTPENNYGLIVTYAPYTVNAVNSNYSYANTTISFWAYSLENQTLLLDICACTVNNYILKYQVPIATGVHKYSVNTRMLSGPDGNIVEIFDRYAETHANKDMVLFNNITFNYSDK